MVRSGTKSRELANAPIQILPYKQLFFSVLIIAVTYLVSNHLALLTSAHEERLRHIDMQ